MQSMSAQVKDHVRAGFSGLWIRSEEHDEAVRELYALAERERWQLATWDCDRGLTLGTTSDPSATDPVGAVKSLSSMAQEDQPGLLACRNLHRFMAVPEVVQAIITQIEEGKTRGTHLLILAPVVDIPTELQRMLVVIEHDLPTREDLNRIAEQIGTEPGEMPEEPAELGALLDASAGLTRYEAEGAFSLSLARHGRITPGAVWELKTAALKRTGLIELHRGTERFDDLGGLDALKTFTRRALARQEESTTQPRGIMLLGVPGTGKSAFAKALGNETGRPTLLLDPGALMGSLVGQTEENTRRALKIADAMSPCILFIDEIEKALAGAGGSGANDSGVSARMLGSLLSWLNDHTTDVFVVCTSNDISKLPPEFTRAERFDGIFFLDFPTAPERDRIWNLYAERYRLAPHANRPADENWTGAEIRACCRLSALLKCSLDEAAANIVPINATAGAKVSDLRHWANGRCLDASRPGIYRDTHPITAPAEPAKAKARRIQRPTEPGAN